jgi:hypothetical protein
MFSLSGAYILKSALPKITIVFTFLATAKCAIPLSRPRNKEVLSISLDSWLKEVF